MSDTMSFDAHWSSTRRIGCKQTKHYVRQFLISKSAYYVDGLVQETEMQLHC